MTVYATILIMIGERMRTKCYVTVLMELSNIFGNFPYIFYGSLLSNHSTTVFQTIKNIIVLFFFLIFIIIFPPF